MQTSKTTFTLQDKQAIHKGHIHFYDFIDSFHGLEDQPDYETQHRQIQERLRQQYLTENNWEESKKWILLFLIKNQELCYRNCFKFDQKKYIEFCLDRKCGGIPFQKAASIMGYVKTPGQKTTHADHHHHH